MKRTRLLTAALGLPAAFLGLGLGLGLALAAPAMAATPEQAPVAALDAALIAAMKHGGGFQARYDILAPVVRQSFDLDAILQTSVGFLWPTLPADQKARLQSVFATFTIASYANAFSGYHGETFELLAAERAVGSRKVVETKLVAADGSATELDYVMTDGADGWHITDVLFNGTISKVAVQVSDFSSLVTTGDASALIAALQKKIVALSGGALKG
jgi:phospholipid transport system substrate-binding protein